MMHVRLKHRLFSGRLPLGGNRLGLLSALVMAMVFCGPPTAANGQQLSITSRGPHYVGFPIQVDVRFTTDFDGEFAAGWEPPADQPIVVRGPTRSGRQMSFNGRRTAITHQLGFDVSISEVGEYDIGPFVIKLGGEEYETNTITVDVEELTDDEGLLLEFDADLTKLYVGQKIQCSLTWGATGGRAEINHAYARSRIRADFLEDFEILESNQSSDTPLNLFVGGQEYAVPAASGEEVVGGQRFITLTSKFDIVPKRVLERDAAKLTCNTRTIVAIRRGGFLSFRDQIEDKPARSSATTGAILVKPIPQVGRPASFNGAVGTDFALNVTAVRDSVQVGDPLEVKFQVSGNGFVDRLSLPKLDTMEDGLAEAFQLPSQLPTGQTSGDVREFAITVRAKSSDITEFPPVEFSWFNPELARFETTVSNSVPLTVRDAKRVSASSVVSGNTGVPGTAQSSGQSQAVAPEMQVALAANLALPATDQLIAPAPWLFSRSMMAACYVGALLLVAVALVGRLFATAKSKDERVQFDDLVRRLDGTARLDTSSQCETIAEVISAATNRLSGRDADSFRTRSSRIAERADAIRFAPNTSGETDSEVTTLADELKSLLKQTTKELR